MTRASICLAGLALTAISLQGQLSVDGGPAWKDFAVRFESKIEPGGAVVANDSGSVIDPGVHGNAQRFIYDEKNKRTFGYEVLLEPSADGRTAQLRIEPLHDPEHALRNGWSMGSLPLGLPKYPVIPDLKIGDTVALDLLVNPATGQKLVDYLTIIRAGIPGAPHDFSLEDVWLSLDTPRVTVDGKPLTPGNQHSNVGGRAVWIDIGGRGRFLLSLFPNEKLGFRKSGMTESNNTMTFQMEGMVVHVECASPIVQGSGPFNIYVLHEQNPGPMPVGQFGVSAGGPVEKLIAEPRR